MTSNSYIRTGSQAKEIRSHRRQKDDDFVKCNHFVVRFFSKLITMSLSLLDHDDFQMQIMDPAAATTTKTTTTQSRIK